MDREKLLKGPTRLLDNLIQNGSNMIQAKRQTYGSTDQSAATTSTEQPLNVVIPGRFLASPSSAAIQKNTVEEVHR